MNRIRGADGKWIRLRMAFLCGVLATGLGLVLSASYGLMIEDGPHWRELAERQRERRLRVRPKRGVISDRNGSALAVSVEVPTISLDALELLRGVAPNDVPAVARDAALRISKALALEPALVERKILGKRRWTWLKRAVSAAEVEAVRTLSSGEDGGSKVRGLMVEGEPRRFYPRREVGAPLLGFVSPDGKGRDGLEFALNEELEGNAEQLKGLRDRSGKLIFESGTPDDAAFAGHDIELTIDQAIQFTAERELSNAARAFEAVGGSVVVVDPRTGEVLAMASFPGFNPNDYGRSDPGDRRSRGAVDAFEPGSTIKIFTVGAALEEKSLAPTDQLFCEDGAMRIDNVTIRDTHPAGWLPIAQVLAQSSNICAAKIGLALGGDKLYEGLRRFGFGQRSGLPLAGESSGTLRPRGRPWVQVETASAAFGQGISVTNLQLAMATAAIANGGELMEPILVRRVRTASGELVREAAPRVRRRVLSPKVAAHLTEMLIAVTEDGGTGIEAAVDGHRVAGKTATAQKADPKTGRYSLDNYVASFVGFVPAHDPVVAIAVTLDEPRVEHAGGSVAAPVFRQVAQMVLRSRGVSPRDGEKVPLAEVARRPDPARAAHALLAGQGAGPAVQEIQVAGRVG
ncbi:MAG TPA: penicillin-binding protein 2, partial [Polyangiaceae bacterium]|nr:penicillin-binding protein 2 [Polyangiaceae bacterium]